MEIWVIVLIVIIVISFMFVFSLTKVASQQSRADEKKEAEKAEEENV